MRRFKLLEPWQKNLWAGVAIQILSLLAFQAGAVLVPYYIQDMGITDIKQVAAWTAAWQSVGAITFAIFTPIWGAMGDRFGRKPNLIRASAATAVMMALTGFVKVPWQLLALRAVQGMLTGTPAAATALIAVGTPRNQLAYALGLLQTAFFIGMSLGPMVGGYIGDAVGFRPTFIISSIVVLIGLYIVLKFTSEPEESTAVKQAARNANMLRSFRDLLGVRSLAILVVLTVVINLTGSILSPAMPIYIQQLIPLDKTPASVAGTVFGAGAMAAAVSAVVVGKLSDRVGRRRAMLVCSAGVALLFVPQGLAPTAAFLGVFVAMQGLFRGGLGPNLSAMVVASVSKDKTGSALGLSSSAASIGFAVGPMLGAAIMATASTRMVFFVAAAMFALVTLVAAWATREPHAGASAEHEDIKLPSC
jgi:DHA1 family multidrug resistance protein-like MFS transporter